MTSSSSLPSPSLQVTDGDRELQKSAVLELQFRSWSTNPWEFIRSSCKTIDDNDPDSPPKFFPERCHPYLKWIIHIVHMYRMVAIKKSRQVMVSWIMVAYCLWHLMFKEHARVIIQSKGQDESDKMVARMKVMWENLPQWVQDRCPIRFLTSTGTVVGSRSEVLGLPDVADAIRSEAATLIWSDETAHQKDAAGSYKAMRPALGAAGTGSKAKGVFTSSIAPGFFNLLIKDKVDLRPPPEPLDERDLMPWLKFRLLGRSRLVVLELNFRADPEKAKPEWIDSMRSSMSNADWMQEFEADEDARAGQPAFPIITSHREHIVENPFDIPAHWPRYPCGDYGTRNATTIYLVAVDPKGCAHVYWEHHETNPDLPWHLDRFKEHEDFHRLATPLILDQSCWNKTQQTSYTTLEGITSHSLKSIAELYMEHGVPVMPAARVEDRVKVAIWDKAWLPVLREEAPSCKIWSTCPKLIREFELQRWQEFSDAQQLQHNVKEKLVDKDNHGFDAVSYFELFRSECAIEVIDQVPVESAKLFFRRLTQGSYDKAMLAAQEEEEAQQYAVVDDW